MPDNDNYGITIVQLDEENAFATDSNHEEYDENLLICNLNLPYTISDGDLIIFKNETNTVTSIHITYDESLAYNLDNDWQYDIYLRDIDLTNISEGDELSFVLSSNNIIYYETNLIAHKIGEKIYLTTTTGSEISTVDSTIRATNDKLFQARVFLEKNKNVYGAEIILFDNNDEEINRILITDDTKYEAMNNFLENMKKAYVPYTSHDVEIVDVLSRYSSDSDEYIQANNEWSNLSTQKDLKTILENSIDGVSEGDKVAYTNSGKTIINATHLNNYDSSNFSKVGHTHDDLYLTRNHTQSIGVNGNLGHLRLVDNLNTNDVSGGQVLSANQGYELNKRVSNLEKKFSWEYKKYNNYLSYYINTDLHLIAVNYYRTNYTGFKNDTGEKVLHKGFPYIPSQRAISSLYRGDMSFYIKTTGDICVYSLSKLASKNIIAQVLYHYK